MVTSDGDLVTGIEHAASAIVGRGVLLDLGRFLRPEASDDGLAGELQTATPSRPPSWRPASPRRARRARSAAATSCSCARAATPAPARGLERLRRRPSAGLSFTTAGWLHRTEIAAIATDTWGFEVRPNEFDDAFQPLHQVVIPNIGLTIGEMWDLEALAADCAADGCHEFLLVAPRCRSPGPSARP